jgi:hypothetical protein
VFYPTWIGTHSRAISLFRKFLLPRYDFLTPPPPLAGNAANAAVKEREIQVLNKAAISRAYYKLRAKYVNSIPAEDISELSIPIYGISCRSFREIHAHITNKYSVLTPADFLIIHARLRRPKTAVQSFAEVASIHRELHETMALARQPLSELDKCNFYTEAIENDPSGDYATQLYTQLQPFLLQRTFAALVAHVTMHAPNHTATARSMKLSAAFAAQSERTPDTISSAFAVSSTDIAALTAEIAQLRKTNQELRGVKGPRTGKSRPKFYCWVHGATFHSGDRCTVMLADPSKYTPAHLAAKTASSPPGGCTKA